VPITEANPFKGRQYPGQVIVTTVRGYLRYPLAYEHVSELLTERGLPVDASCIWRWVQAYAPERELGMEQPEKGRAFIPQQSQAFVVAIVRLAVIHSCHTRNPYKTAGT
jgi:hypothetical protein